MIFLDVGAHEGQTLEEVVKPCYQFERIYAFEPMPAQYEILQRRFGGLERVTLLNYGLAYKTGKMSMYGNNNMMEATVFAAKRDADEDIVTVCDFVSAADFFRQEIASTEQTVVKLNCEGSEILVMDSLVDSGEIEKVHEVMIDFDIRKVMGREWEEAVMVEKLASVGFDRYSLCEDVMHGATHQQRIAAWLQGVTL